MDPDFLLLAFILSGAVFAVGSGIAAVPRGSMPVAAGRSPLPIAAVLEPWSALSVFAALPFLFELRYFDEVWIWRFSSAALAGFFAVQVLALSIRAPRSPKKGRDFRARAVPTASVGLSLLGLPFLGLQIWNLAWGTFWLFGTGLLWLFLASGLRFISTVGTRSASS